MKMKKNNNYDDKEENNNYDDNEENNINDDMMLIIKLKVKLMKMMMTTMLKVIQFAMSVKK